MAREKNGQEPGAPPQVPTEEQIELAQREARKIDGPRPGCVTVANKLPNGIWLQLSYPENRNEPVMGGGHREVTQWRKSGPRYLVQGPAIPIGVVPTFQMAKGGFRLTFGIPKDFWDEWLRQNKDSDFVVRGLVYAHESLDNVTDHCIEHENVRSGLEPIDPANLPREFQRPASSNLGPIQTAPRT